MYQVAHYPYMADPQVVSTWDTEDEAAADMQKRIEENRGVSIYDTFDVEEMDDE